MALTTQHMEAHIRAYFNACNSGDAQRIAAYFTPQGRHLFPAGSPFGALEGALVIGECWARCVQQLGSHWTVDNIVADATKRQAVIEWTHFKPTEGQILRGDEWYRFAEDGRIEEIRAYYACPTHPGVSVHEIGGFDYQGLGYPMQVPNN